MEKVWNDISLSSLLQHNDNHRTFHFQDFFSANNRDPSPRQTRARNDTSFSGVDGISTERLSSVTSTTLSLNTTSSDPDDQFDFGTFGYPTKTTTNLVSSKTMGICLACDRENDNDNNNKNKKRARENSVSIETSDQRHKRLMKSRESADRARIKKQAHTSELEQELDRLRKENDELTNNIAKLNFASQIAEVQKKPTLRRTLTALF